MKNFYFTYALLLCLLHNTITTYTPLQNQTDRFALSACHSISGTIQFPALNTLPQIRIYCSGTKILTEADKSTNSLYFTIPKGSYQQAFYILITETVDYEMAECQDNSNTIAHLKIPKTQKYKFFSIQLIIQKKSEKNKDNPSFEWVVEEKLLTDSGRIPDDAIIVCCNPEFVESIQGSHYRDLPTIKIRSDLIQFIGSEAKMHDQINEVVLATIDIDTLHSKARQEQCIKISHNKVLIAPSIT